MQTQLDALAKDWGKELFATLNFEILYNSASDGKTRSEEHTPSYQGKSNFGPFLIIPVSSLHSTKLTGKGWSKLRRHIWEQGQLGAPEIILTEAILKDIIQRSIPSFQQRMDDLLNVIMKFTPKLGKGIEFEFTAYEPINDFQKSDVNAVRRRIDGWLPEEHTVESLFSSGAIDIEEFFEYLNYLEKRSFIKRYGTRVTVQPEGLNYLETIAPQRSKSEQAFVAMWFDDSMKDAWTDGIEPAIRQACYRPMRIDGHEHVNRIDDEILSQIRKSKFVIADFTHKYASVCEDEVACSKLGARGGVYFEAGFALGLGIPVIWTAQNGMQNRLHFDIRQYNCIFWENSEELREKLKNRIEALFGQGPIKP